jgi:two-component sensor histidine kinase
VQSGHGFTEIRTENGKRLDRVFNITGNQLGDIWLADNTQGLFKVRGPAASQVTMPGLDTHDIYRLAVARNGAVWLGRFRGGLTVLQNGSVQTYGVRDGLAAGPVQALYEDAQGAMWAGTGTGLTRFAHGQWTTWTSAQGLPEGGVQGIVEDDNHAMWLLSTTGLLRVAHEYLQTASQTLPYILYGRTEGLRLVRNGAMSNPRMVKARNGRLWLCTEDGVAVVDPARVVSNPVPPPVVIEQLSIDGKPLDIGSPQPLAFRGRDLQIVYAGISLMVPERVRIRYRMVGLERNWTEAGVRRSVNYVNLPPGDYQFRVIAANNDGVWNNVGATLPLRIDPYFYQTRWFAFACLAAAGLLGWSIHWFRVQTVISRLRLVAAERARFSRELHDSLLQGFLGVLYQLEAAARQFATAPEASKQRLDRAIEQADLSLREARQMIVSMRIPALENSTLPDALRVTLSQAVAGLPVDLHFDVKGPVRQGHYDVEANVFLMVREAVTNALNHAEPNRIWVTLLYSERELRLLVQDDGSGFDPAEAAAKTGHCGLRGMRERAKNLGGDFALDTSRGSGTKIQVSVPWKKQWRRPSD